MCGLGLVGGPVAGLSGLAGLSGDAGTSTGDAGDAGDAAALQRGETGVCERVGLTAAGAGFVGEVGVALRCDEDEDNGDGDSDGGGPGEWRAPGDTEKVVGVLRLNLASNSLHTAKLRLVPSAPAGTPNPEAPAASEPLASSWQRSTKLPLRIDPHSLSRSMCLEGRGLAV